MSTMANEMYFVNFETTLLVQDGVLECALQLI